jgi:phospholipid/cholesterol/gamma-HCH transport system permease protein
MPPGSTLDYIVSGDSMELAPVGFWTAAHSRALEERLTAVAPQISAARNLAINMAGVRELDTLGAWLLERLVRGCIDRKIEVRFFDLAERYRGLFDQVNRQPARICYWRGSSGSANQQSRFMRNS